MHDESPAEGVLVSFQSSCHTVRRCQASIPDKTLVHRLGDHSYTALRSVRQPRIKPSTPSPATWVARCTSRAGTASPSPDVLESVKHVAFGFSWIWGLSVLATLLAPGEPLGTPHDRCPTCTELGSAAKTSVVQAWFLQQDPNTAAGLNSYSALVLIIASLLTICNSAACSEFICMAFFACTCCLSVQKY